MTGRDIHADRILILDFGSQYTQLIARRVRELGVFCEIHPWDVGDDAVRAFQPKGVILSGGPESVTQQGAPAAPEAVWSLGVPVLGICYGMQTMAAQLGGRVEPGAVHEFGYAEIRARGHSKLLEGIEDRVNAEGHGLLDVWMSHGDRVVDLPAGFKVIASTPDLPIGGMADETRRFYALQFHPEVTHTKQGTRLYARFLHDICGCAADWNAGSIIDDAIARVRAQVGKGRVLLGLSGVADPEAKRKIIGRLFIEVFDEEAAKIQDVGYLAQGTIYPDVIESAGAKNGKAHVIKSHHNVGGLPEHMKLQLVEPLRELFKDEVRRIGLELGLPAEMVQRHPFPGPGLGVRILGEVTPAAADTLRLADHIFIEELRKAGWYEKTSQAFAVFLPVKSVGVTGDGRRHEPVIALRAVETVDFMTARWAHLPYELLDVCSRRIVNEVKGISRVVYDITGKPPATIEWE